MTLEDAELVQYEDHESNGHLWNFVEISLDIVNSFSITNKNESFWFSCGDENSKKEWVLELNKVLQKLHSRMNSINGKKGGKMGGNLGRTFDESGLREIEECKGNFGAKICVVEYVFEISRKFMFFL